MSYQTALERLLAHEPKELARGRYTDNRGLHCVIGAICPEFRRCKGYQFVQQLPVEWLEASGLTWDEAKNLQDTNDSFEMSERDRYSCMVKILLARVATEQRR